jgi:hypothetical protein
MKSYSFNDDVYDIGYELLLGLTNEELKAWGEVRGNTELGNMGDWHGVCITFNDKDGGGHIAIGIHKNVDNVIKIVNHEIYHAVTSVMETRGVPIKVGQDEAGAYYTGWLSNIVLPLAYAYYVKTPTKPQPKKKKL